MGTRQALLAMLGEDDARAPEAKEQEEPVLRPVAESTGIPKAADPESAPVQEKPAARRRRGGFSSSFGAAPVAVQPQGENLEAQTRSTITTAAVSESVQDGATTDEVPSMEALLAMLDEDREG
ncbi:nipblb [Symbiodinium natans]|uniref:Nipblb protein n=1 Tax=Symbiodinium natans TaxID=878477 RepID=A0A812P9L5_9DINO|nr:nipblb [Symbiodinium natans]